MAACQRQRIPTDIRHHYHTLYAKLPSPLLRATRLCNLAVKSGPLTERRFIDRKLRRVEMAQMQPSPVWTCEFGSPSNAEVPGFRLFGRGTEPAISNLTSQCQAFMRPAVELCRGWSKPRPSSTGRKLSPRGVSLYSTRGGTSAWAVRVTTP